LKTIVDVEATTPVKIPAAERMIERSMDRFNLYP
jgi:hypothetical protein